MRLMPAAAGLGGQQEHELALGRVVEQLHQLWRLFRLVLPSRRSTGYCAATYCQFLHSEH